MKICIKNISFLLVLIGLLYILLFSVTAKKNTYDNILVVKVFDGDTILLESGEKVRLIGIDCPEAYENDKLTRDAQRTGQDIKAIIEMGKKATEFTKNLIEGKKIRLELDVERKDKYERLLAYLFLKASNLRIIRDTDTTKFKNGIPYLFVNAEIIADGFAQPMAIPPNVKYAELFQKLYQDARENKRGLWNL
ncbi:MAG: thermonuclease family protein [Candidatus Omnitrophica bacterium]|nr:thermonuclease family protein [Candidatus Omnitrophota bacterium]